MKYKVINNHDIVKKTRAEYLFNQFCIDKELDVKTFVHRVKEAYYKYDAPVYKPSHTETMSWKLYYLKFCQKKLLRQ